MTGPAAAAHDHAPSRAQEEGGGRSAQVDCEIPAPRDAGAPKNKPVEVAPALGDHKDFVEAGQSREQSRGHRPAGDREAGLRMLSSKVLDQPGGQHRVS